MKKVLYIDMDNVLVNFESGIQQLSEEQKAEYKGRYDEVPGIFARMRPIDGALEAVRALAKVYDIYILSTAPWNNPSAWSDKLEWIKRYLGEYGYKRLILTHHKDLNHGDFLIDDRESNGAKEFMGELIRFGKDGKNWEEIMKYLMMGKQ